MTVSLIKKLNLTPLKAMLAFSLTEALLAAVLVGVVSALAIGALNVSGQIQGIQSNKIVQAAMMEVQSAFTKYKQRNGMVDESTSYNAMFDSIDGTDVVGLLQLDSYLPTGGAFPTASCNQAAAPLFKCKRLKSGAVVMYNGSAFTWGAVPIYPPRNIRVAGIIIDPDGVDSTATNDAGQSVKLLFSMQGHFLTSTPWQWTQIGATVQQPNYFRLDK
jgi:type II secretory pathway pseudopilin PulG